MNEPSSKFKANNTLNSAATALAGPPDVDMHQLFKVRGAGQFKNPAKRPAWIRINAPSAIAKLVAGPASAIHAERRG
ncbi:MAG: hypothetical protein WDO18_07720 [Acidobacteriota bacterium]